MANAQQNDEEIKTYRTAITGLILEDVKFGPTNATLLCDVSSGQPRPIVPSSWHRKVLRQCIISHILQFEQHVLWLQGNSCGMA